MIPSERPVDRLESPRARRIVLGALTLSLLFEVANVIGTQAKAVFVATPWHDDPYHAVLLATMFTVGMLAAALAARMLVWSAPGAADRAAQMLRGAGVLVAAIALAAGFQWTSVAARQHSRAWNGSTTLQIAALAVVSAAGVLLAIGLVTARGTRRAGWSNDWLGDAALLAARIPRVGRAASPNVVAWIRRRATLVFATVSVLVAVPIVAAQALGEQWTDPVLIAWALVVLTATVFAFCVIANALAGIVIRPPRSRRRRIAEGSAVAGCLAIQASEAFHDQIWRALTGHPVGAVGTLVALTVGSGLLGAATCAAVTAVSGGSGGAR